MGCGVSSCGVAAQLTNIANNIRISGPPCRRHQPLVTRQREDSLHKACLNPRTNRVTDKPRCVPHLLFGRLLLITNCKAVSAKNSVTSRPAPCEQSVLTVWDVLGCFEGAELF